MDVIIKKRFFLFVLSISLLLSFQPMIFTAMAEDSIVDDSLRDMSLVLGAGAAGAVLGLSTLSFVDTPSEHLKNIAVGGAIGIVIGVGAVVFTQANRSTSEIGMLPKPTPMNPEKFATITRKEFSEVKIAKDFLKVPSFGYSFSF